MFDQDFILKSSISSKTLFCWSHWY